MSRFYIKDNYKENISNGEPKMVYNSTPPGLLYQHSVFRLIRNYIKRKNQKIENIIDFGCGSAFKLNKYLGDPKVSITGVDQSFAIKLGKECYPKFTWIEDDFSRESTIEFPDYDVIISSDVIEHLVNPLYLLNRIKKCSHSDSVIFISTPERDLVRGFDSFGPPENQKHVREWNKQEFGRFLKEEGFEILEHKVVPAKKLSIYEKAKSLFGFLNNKTCQIVVCKYNG